MKSASKSADLLKKLSRDPRLKQAVAKARRKTRGTAGNRVESAANMILLVLAIAARFSKRKKARALDDLMDALYLLVQVSLLVKENIFDRREVKQFFRQGSKRLYLLARECVAMILPQPERRILARTHLGGP